MRTSPSRALFAAAAVAVLCPTLPASADEGAGSRQAAMTAAAESTAEAIDFEGFLALSGEVAAARRERLLPLDDFLARAARPETLLLDTRSAAAYAAKHLAGAVHLNLSDLTAESLARVVGPRDRTILIYCNNNFVDDEPPFVKKKAAAALNIPTFVSLWAYGYRDVYELGELVEQADPRLEFEGALADAGS